MCWSREGGECKPTCKIKKRPRILWQFFPFVKCCLWERIYQKWIIINIERVFYRSLTKEKKKHLVWFSASWNFHTGTCLGHKNSVPKPRELPCCHRKLPLTEMEAQWLIENTLYISISMQRNYIAPQRWHNVWFFHIFYVLSLLCSGCINTVKTVILWNITSI